MAELNIPITKAGNKTIKVDTDSIPEEMFKMALEEGLKVMLNKKMSKVKSAKGLSEADVAKEQAAAMEIAGKNLEDILANKMKKGRAAGASKVAGVVMTEARRLAKEVIKNEIRAAGMKVSHIEASQITALANELLKTDESYIKQAEANIEQRKAKVNDDKDAAMALLQKLGGIAESPKLVAKAEKEAAAKKATLSKTQAGKVAPRKAKAASTEATA
jgi:hypothetical protein